MRLTAATVIGVGLDCRRGGERPGWVVSASGQDRVHRSASVARRARVVVRCTHGRTAVQRLTTNTEGVDFDDRELASYLRIEELELEGDGRN